MILSFIICTSIGCEDPSGVTITDTPNGKNFQCMASGGLAECVFQNLIEEPPPPPVPSVPTLSEWGLIAMASILGIVGFMVIRRRKVTV